MGRLQSGRAPLCDTHYTYSLDCIVGVVTSADLEGDEGTAECRITRRDDRAGTVQDIVDGIIANVSVGYALHRMLMIQHEPEGDYWLSRHIDWDALTLSLVPVVAYPDVPVEPGHSSRARRRPL